MKKKKKIIGMQRRVKKNNSEPRSNNCNGRTIIKHAQTIATKFNILYRQKPKIFFFSMQKLTKQNKGKNRITKCTIAYGNWKRKKYERWTLFCTPNHYGLMQKSLYHQTKWIQPNASQHGCTMDRNDVEYRKII